MAAAAALVAGCGLLGWQGGTWGMGAALSAALLRVVSAAVHVHA
ncbi:MAG: hypothetical protein QE285_18335 [Aquabacterium sp.]|nr:hypothetical protein [Aquabacterium sp.]